VRSARRAIADLLRRPLGELGKADLDFISALVERTLKKKDIEAAIHERFQKRTGG